MSDDDTIDPASEQVLLSGIISGYGGHQAGDVQVGHDGYLYISTGDGSCDFRGDSSIVESYVSYLRRKVDAVEPRLIHTIRSVGYVLRLPGP